MKNKQIAAFLRECAARCPNADDSQDGEATFMVPDTRLTIKCKYDRASILKIATKYERGYSHPTNKITRPGMARPKTPSKRVFMRLWEDGEYANAREYLELYDVTLWPQELARLAGGYSRIEGVRA